MTTYTLPPLPYAYDALEPHISAEIMELHHDKHHQAYVDGANRAVEMLNEARAKDEFTNIAALERQLQEFISTAFTNPDVQGIWVDANRVLHRQVIAFLRGDTTALQIRDGIVYLDVYPIIDTVLRQLQQMGIIPALRTTARVLRPTPTAATCSPGTR